MVVWRSRNYGESFNLAIVVTAAGVVVGGGYRWWLHRRRRAHSGQPASLSDEERNLLQQQRKEERTGRIRAEVRLRTALKKVQQLQIQLLGYEGRTPKNGMKLEVNDDVTKDHGTNDVNGNESMLIQCIGTVTSPFTKRMGTPRQGALVPASRGFVQFKSQFPAELASGLELYSHVWIIFEFHANTDLGAAANGSSKKTKVRPPRAGGIKVGQLATRSPHRPNPLGLSLVAVDRWDSQQRRLHIFGLDLVNGTPVYDIKPVVPWDIPGYSNHRSLEMVNVTSLRVPDWVSCNEDVIEQVSFTEAAQQQLHDCISAGKFSPLYPDDVEGIHAAKEMIRQILAQDPRSSHKGLKRNARGTVNARQSSSEHSLDVTEEACYSLILCQTKVSFSVKPSGCEVVEILPIEFEETQYVDGVPLVSGGVD